MLITHINLILKINIKTFLITSPVEFFVIDSSNSLFKWELVPIYFSSLSGLTGLSKYRLKLSICIVNILNYSQFHSRKYLKQPETRFIL